MSSLLAGSSLLASQNCLVHYLCYSCNSGKPCSTIRPRAFYHLLLSVQGWGTCSDPNVSAPQLSWVGSLPSMSVLGMCTYCLLLSLPCLQLQVRRLSVKVLGNQGALWEAGAWLETLSWRASLSLNIFGVVFGVGLSKYGHGSRSLCVSFLHESA